MCVHMCVCILVCDCGCDWLSVLVTFPCVTNFPSMILRGLARVWYVVTLRFHLPRVHCVPSTLHSGVHLCSCIKYGRLVLSQQLCDT